MKILTTLLILVFMSSLAGAIVSSDRSISTPLEWYMTENGTWGDIRTKYDKDTQKYILGYWDVPGLKIPTSVQLEVIINEYEQYLIDQAAEKGASKQKTLQKLNMTDEQLKELKEALELTNG